MSDTVDLTFAELEFLFAEDRAWPETRAAIGIESSAAPDAIVAAGLASLIVRGLVRATDDHDMVLDETLSAAVTVLSLPAVWLDLAVEQPEATLAGYAGLATGEPIVVLSISAPGVFSVQVHDSAGDAAAAFGRLVGGLADAATKVLVRARSLGADNTVFAVRSEDGSLAVGAGPDLVTAATAEQIGAGAAILARTALAP